MCSFMDILPLHVRCLGCPTSLKVLKLDFGERSTGQLCSVLIKKGIPIE